jgi:hypothetical protein
MMNQIEKKSAFKKMTSYADGFFIWNKCEFTDDEEPYTNI